MLQQGISLGFWKAKSVYKEDGEIEEPYQSIVGLRCKCGNSEPSISVFPPTLPRVISSGECHLAIHPTIGQTSPGFYDVLISGTVSWPFLLHQSPQSLSDWPVCSWACQRTTKKWAWVSRCSGPPRTVSPLVQMVWVLFLPVANDTSPFLSEARILARELLIFSFRQLFYDSILPVCGSCFHFLLQYIYFGSFIYISRDLPPGKGDRLCQNATLP